MFSSQLILDSSLLGMLSSSAYVLFLRTPHSSNRILGLQPMCPMNTNFTRYRKQKKLDACVCMLLPSTQTASWPQCHNARNQIKGLVVGLVCSSQARVCFSQTGKHPQAGISFESICCMPRKNDPIISNKPICQLFFFFSGTRLVACFSVGCVQVETSSPFCPRPAASALTAPRAS